MHQHRQIHVWISESDYLLLRERSTMARETVSSQIRRLIKAERQRLKHPAPGTRHRAPSADPYITSTPSPSAASC